MINPRTKLASLVLLTALCGSCSSVGTYAEDRLRDAADVIAVLVAPGTAEPESLVVGIEPTAYIPIGLGFSHGRAYGTLGRSLGEHNFTVANFSVLIVVIEILLSPIFESIDLSLVDERFAVHFDRTKPRGWNGDRRFRLGAHVGVPYFFLYADVELGELLDFALGFLGLDLMKDDSSYARKILEQGAEEDSEQP